KETGVTCHPTYCDLRVGSHHRIVPGLRLRGRLRPGSDALDLHGWLPGSPEGRHNVRSSRAPYTRAGQTQPSGVELHYGLTTAGNLLAQRDDLRAQPFESRHQLGTLDLVAAGLLALDEKRAVRLEDADLNLARVAVVVLVQHRDQLLVGHGFAPERRFIDLAILDQRRRRTLKGGVHLGSAVEKPHQR